MSTETLDPSARFAGATGPEHCIAQRDDGVYADPAVLGTTLAAAVDSVFRSGRRFTGTDYPVLAKALTGHGPDFPRGPDGQPVVRIAAGIAPFDPVRRALYRAVKIAGGQAQYYFEPAWLPDPLDPAAPERPARLDVDEFIADVWLKGIRCGVDVEAVRAAIDAAHAGRADRVTVARRLDPVPGEDAHIVEVSDDIHRSNAPRQRADGRLDLSSFQNRFPQVQAGVRLLQKVAATKGVDGVEMSGTPLPSTPGRDVDLAPLAGPGTAVERSADGEFLVARQTGFLSVDPKTSRVSVGDKIVSHDGVSAKTTGNLQLTGDYEEFGAVQELRTLEGEGITVHGDVYGRLVSRGGQVLLHANLVGGSVASRRGDIRVRGVASGAVVQAEDGAVLLERAENCTVSGTRVRIAHAINCDVIGDDVEVGLAEGSAIAGRRVTVEATLPRRQSEMIVAVLCPQDDRLEEVLAAVAQRVAQFGELAARLKGQMDALTTRPDVRRYLMLASRVRKNEVTLSPEQARQFQRMGQDVAPALKTIGAVSAQLKAAEAERQAGTQMLERLERQRTDAASVASLVIQMVQGETQARVLGYSPATGNAPYRMAPRDIRARLRGPQDGELLFSGSSGQVAWSSAPALSDG